MSNLLLKIFRKNSSSKYILHRHCRQLSGKVAIKDSDVQNDESAKNELQKSEKLGAMYVKKFKRKPQRPPYVKNIFLGVVDTDLLAYPEALEKEDYERLINEIQPVQYFFDNMKESSLNKKEFNETLRQLKLFGMQAGQLQGGRELNLTETCRFNEIISQNTSDVQLLNSEQCGVQTLLKVGSEKQMVKYLDDIINGKIKMGLCISEELGCDPSNFQTTATFDSNKKQYILKGKKFHVINGDSADLFIVFAKTRKMGPGVAESNISAFLVERNFGNVTSTSKETLGLSCSDIATVEFDNTPVPEDNLLGDANKGLDMYAKLLPQIHLMNATASTQISKQALTHFIQYCKGKHSQENNLIEAELVFEKISSYSTSIYAMESMVYLTAGLIDIYENQDCETETTISKCFSAEHSINLTLNIMQFMGSESYYPDHWSNQLHRDALSYALVNDSLDNMKIIIALQGLRHAGIQLQELVKRIRNPFFYSAEALKRMWNQRKHLKDDPNLTLQLNQYLHPSALQGADWMEYSIHRIKFATELMLSHYGNEAPLRHIDLKRLGECAVDVYAMTACLARASRSYCIGLAHSDYEMLLANTFCQKAMLRVKERIRRIDEGPFVSSDAVHRKLAEKTFHVDKYFPEHPLTRNF